MKNFVQEINQYLKQKILNSVNTKDTQQDRFKEFIKTIKPDIEICVDFMENSKDESSGS